MQIFGLKFPFLVVCDRSQIKILNFIFVFFSLWLEAEAGPCELHLNYCSLLANSRHGFTFIFDGNKHFVARKTSNFKLSVRHMADMADRRYELVFSLLVPAIEIWWRREAEKKRSRFRQDNRVCRAKEQWRANTPSPNLLCANKRIISDRTHNCKVKRANERTTTTTIGWEAEKRTEKFCVSPVRLLELQMRCNVMVNVIYCRVRFLSLFPFESHSHGFYAPICANELHVWNALAHAAGLVRRFVWIVVNQLRNIFISIYSKQKSFSFG